MSSEHTLPPDRDDSPSLPEPPMDGPGLFGDPPPAAPAPAPAAPASGPAEPEAAQPYRVLARKYRPTRFDDLIGQDALVRTLRNAFAQGRVAHAFMLTGVRGVGKTTTARIIARALNCTGPDGQGGPTADPCGVCPNCRAILADRHPDVLELDAASNNGVDDVRELREMVRFRPTQGRCKVFVLDEVHMLSGAAFNALLKTLEEPPPGVRFVFATTELRKVPATILSRCQTFHLKRVPQDTLARHFAAVAAREGASLEPEALAMVARAADGSVRDGLSLLDQAISQADRGPDGMLVTAESVRGMLGLADRGAVMDAMEAAMRGDAAAALDALGRAHESGADPGVVLSDLAELCHVLTRMVAVPATRDDPALPELERTRGAALAAALSVPVLGRAWGMLLKGIEEVALSPDRLAAAEMTVIRLCHVADLPTPGEILRRLGPATATGTAAGPAAGAGPRAMPGSGAENGAGARAAPAMAAGPSGSRPDGPPPPWAAASGPPAGGVALRAVAGGAPLREAAPRPDPAARPEAAAAISPGLAAPEVAPEAGPEAAAEIAPAPAPRPGTWREVVALASGRAPLLHANLRHLVHPIGVSPRPGGGGRIEIRPQPGAPRDLAAQLSALLADSTGERWTIVLGNAEGGPTLAQQGAALARDRLAEARDHPLVLEVLRVFPEARLGEVHDATLDDYGLPPASDPAPDGEPVDEDNAERDAAMEAGPGFAPPDAQPAGMDDVG